MAAKESPQQAQTDARCMLEPDRVDRAQPCAQLEPGRRLRTTQRAGAEGVLRDRATQAEGFPRQGQRLD